MKKILLFLLLTVFSFGYAQSIGDFQTRPTGVTWPQNWNTAVWQVFTSTGWQDTTAYPGQTPGNYTVTILDGDEVNTTGLASVTIGNLYVKGTLNLTQNFSMNTFGTGPVPYLYIDNGRVNITKNVDFRLPAGSNIYMTINNKNTQGIHEEGGCTGSTRIYIGTNIFTACQGTSGTEFTEVNTAAAQGSILADAVPEVICLGGSVNLIGDKVGTAVATDIKWMLINRPSGPVSETLGTSTTVPYTYTASPAVLNEAGDYVFQFSFILGNEGLKTKPVNVRVNGPTFTTTPAAATTYCHNVVPAPLSVVASGAGTLTYQWYTNTLNNNTGGDAIPGATASSYTPPTNTLGTLYYYVVVTADCGVARSNTAQVTVNPSTATVTAHPASAGYCQNTTAAALTVAGNNVTGYQWYSSATATGPGELIPGATSASYVPPTADVGTVYYYALLQGSCGAAPSNRAAVTVSAALTYGNLNAPDSVTICQGGSVTATGQVYGLGVTEAAGQGTATAEFGYSSSDTNPSGAGWTWVPATFNLQNGNNDEFRYTFTPPAAGTYYYTFRYRNGSCGYYYGGYSATGGGAWNGSRGTGTNVSGVLTVNSSAAQTITRSSLPATTSQSVCVNTAVAPITYTLGGGAVSATVSGLPSGVTGSLTGNVYTISGTPTQPGIFNYTVTTSGNGCSAAATATGTITVNRAIGFANLQWLDPTGVNQTVCLGVSRTAYGTVYVEGVTPGAGMQGAGITAEFGYSTTNSNPATWTNWYPASFNAAGGGTQNDEYQYTFTPPASGTYYYTFRYRSGGCAWYYGGYSSGGGGQWNGSTNVSGVLTAGATSTYTTTGWTNGTPNNNGLNAVFETSYNTASGNINACNCEVKAGVTLTVGAGSYIEIQNGIINNGTISVESDGNLIQRDDTGTYTGAGTAFKVKRNANLKRLDYNYWASPVSGQNLKSFSPGTLNNRFYTYKEADDTFEIIDPVANTFSDQGKGYAIRAANTLSTTTSSLPFVFTGKPNNGLRSTPLAFSNAAHGYNLVGNPYPSNINFYELYAANSTLIYNTAYFWTNVNPNPAMQGSGYPGSGYLNNYAVLNGTGGIAATSTTADNDSRVPNEFIKVGQGFIVKAKQAGNLQYRNSIRTGNTSGIFFNKNSRPGADQQKDRFWLKLTTPMNVVTTALIGYIENAADGYDADYDADLFGLGADALFTTLQERRLGIQGRAYPMKITDVVPLGTSHYEAGNYTLSLGSREGIFGNGQAVYLKDRQTGTVTNLSEGSYTFAANAGISEGRFEIVYAPESALVTDDTTKEDLVIYRDGTDFILRAQSKKITGVEVYDTAGRLIGSFSPNSTTAVLPAERMLNGVYILKIDQNGKVTSRKIIK